MSAPQLHAQAYISFSKYAGGTDEDNVATMQVINGETYVAGYSSSTDFPVTNGSAFHGNTDLVISKYGNNGNLLYATYLGSLGYEKLYVMKIVNGEVYILATTDSSGYPVTNGSVFHGRNDIVLTKLNVNGGIAFATYLGGSNSEAPPDNINNLFINGNQVIVAGFTNSLDFPVTSGSYNGGNSDGFITKLNGNNGSIIASVFFGGNMDDNFFAAFEENGFIYAMGSTFSPDLPVTIGNSPGPARSIFAIKINANNFSTVYYRYLGGAARSTALDAKVLNGEFHLTGFTSAVNYPVTNGSTFSGIANDALDGFYTKLNSDGGIGFSTFLGTEGLDNLTQVTLENGEVYITGTALSNANPHHWDALAFKINSNGSLAYSKKFSLGLDFQFAPYVVALNGDLYINGITKGPDYPVTNGSQYYTDGTGYFTHLDASGNILYSTFLGKMNSLVPMQYDDGKFYILGTTNIASYPVTDSTVIKGNNDNILAVLRADGTNLFGSYIGGSGNDAAIQMAVGNNDVYFSGRTSSVDYPVTNNVLQQGIGDQFVTRLSFCPVIPAYEVANDTLSPKTQTVCKFGLAQVITGEKITVPSTGLPVIFINGIPTQQVALVEANYQWQVVNIATGPWTNIPAATFKDYRPVLGGADQYYRRLSFTLPECGSALIHTSDTAVALVSNLNAPVINAAGPFTTCPGSAITIGGSPTVSGGNPPYTSYSWDMGAGPVPNPIVSPGNNTIYTLIVTDAAGCQQIGQTAVFVYNADAGPDRSNCAGEPVKIGSVQIPGNGIVYEWQPGATLSNNSIAQPFANPVSVTDYVLTLTVPKSGGTTCSTTDTVRVTPVAAPVTPNFAGPDRVICLKSSASLGTAPEPGFIYTWSPGSYLTSNTTSTTTYFAGNIVMPTPDPAIIYLTAQKDGCSFSDQVVVTTIESRAGFTACGPRIVGLPDRTPNVNETYTWTRISGPGNFTGATNLPQVPVSASVGGTTVYGLTVSYNGGSCFSQVDVPEICTGCNTFITVDAQYRCPSFDVNLGDVSLIASSSLQNPVFTWTPQVGLSAYTGSIVQLTDNVPRIYTVVAIDLNDTSQHCSYTVFVNDPAFSLPVFTAPDTTVCANVPTIIGESPIAGYTYEWTGPGLSNNLISNPIVTIPFETVYSVRVTDGNGCEIIDPVIVNVQNVQADAGDDWQVCGNAVIQLGTPPQPNTTYLWEPQASPWQNGTNQFSAQPEVMVAANITYTVTATTSAGCISTDDVNITINNIPAIPDAADTIACFNSNTLIGSPALPGVIYQWSPATGLSDPNIAQPLANPAVTTTYTLVATFPGSCISTATDEITVTVSNPVFDLPDISFCPDNGSFALGTGTPLNMFSYNWAPAALVSDPLIANPTTLNPPPVITTVFSLTVVNQDGCEYTDNISIIPVTAAPNAGPDKTICKGQAAAIGSASNPISPLITYNWIPAANLDNPASPNPVFTGTTGGTFAYVLIKTDNAVSCTVKDTVIIHVIDSLIPAINGPAVCQNSCVQIGTAPLPGVLYQWTPATGLSNATIANPLACVAAVTTSYTLTATDINGCTSSANVVVGVNGLGAPQVTIPDVIACLGENNVVFNPVITPAGSYSYLWSPDNGTLSNVNILTPVIQTSATGIAVYSLQVTDNNTGCSNTAIGNLTINNCPPSAIVGDYMWFDTDGNGLQDVGELGVSGMIIRLYNNVDFNIATTVTNANGLYTFNNVPPGNGYYVTFSLPAGFVYTVQNVGGVAANNNSKADVNGRSNNFDLIAGASVLNIDAGVVAEGCGPVPVTLLSFTGTLQNREVLLNWQTTAEYNNHYFDVERSNNGSSNFIAIGSVNGSGTTSLPHSYSLVDQHPNIGINYYRLKQVDFDNNASYSNIVPVELNADGVITVYYNNADNTIRVIFNEKQDNLQLKLFANNGQLIRSVRITNDITTFILQLPAVSKGIYLLQIKNGRFNYSKSLLINK